jgi:hypothetical protein
MKEDVVAGGNRKWLKPLSPKIRYFRGFWDSELPLSCHQIATFRGYFRLCAVMFEKVRLYVNDRGSQGFC